MENKVSIKLPEWADNVSCQVKNGMVDVEFVPKKKLKEGDILACVNDVVIYNSTRKDGAIICYGKLDLKDNEIFFLNNPGIGFGYTNCYRFATEEEKQKLFNAMAKEGLRWNAEKKQMDNTPWRAKIGGKYYYIDSNLNIYSDKDMYKYRDNSRYCACNYAKTEKELEIKRNKIKKILEGE